MSQANLAVFEWNEFSKFAANVNFLSLRNLASNELFFITYSNHLLFVYVLLYSNKAFILADSSKFDIVYFANVAKLEEATIITYKKEVNKNIINDIK